MATFDYDAMADDVLKLLLEFGRDDLILRSYGESGDDWNPIRSASDTVVTGAVVDYALREVNGTLILMTDKRVLISPDAEVAPTTAMKVVIDGIEHEIVNAKPVNPAGTVVLYDVQARI